ncbi:recombinase family protein [Sphingomonas mesophila]|uniref:recombinase family protein n=1 Tax=Sphingomonas mesophila TaxID=2303576 RepID=UPI000E576F9E|nr:recombinase family protein [Sphingomonas mesophila]
MGDAPKIVRCAVYTRKSTDEGLNQAFNSLDAQREACEAYAASQRHEGWECSSERYDDGGFSGGSLDRPALKRLLADVAAGKVDVIVIYKIDRLTRALSDFARIVDVLDQAGASFVSVTQSFNTTTSMGRLTLNVLLSFAQFEREVGAERVRDKIAASKKKGMWMGGVCPLGYDVGDRALIVNEVEAATVREIFEQYLELGSVLLLEAELRRRGVHSKLRTSRAGRITGGKPFTRGALYVLLRNCLYVGRVAHAGETYEGKHDAIIARALFDDVQNRLNSNAVKRGDPSLQSNEPLLVGILWDDQGRKMTPNFSVKHNKRYHYYVSRRDRSSDEEMPIRVPAGDLERIVMDRLQQLLLDRSALLELLDPFVSARETEIVFNHAERTAAVLLSGNRATIRNAVCELVSSVAVGDRSICIELLQGLGLSGTSAPPAKHRLVVPCELFRRTREVRLTIPGPPAMAQQDPGLIKLIVRAWEARRAFEGSGGLALAEVARVHGMHPDYFTVLVKLGFLSPAIVSNILHGRQTPKLTRQTLARIRNMPISWSAQQTMLQRLRVA